MSKKSVNNSKITYLFVGVIIGALFIFLFSTIIYKNKNVDHSLPSLSPLDALCLLDSQACTPKPAQTGVGYCDSGSIEKYGKTYSTPKGSIGDIKCTTGSDGSSVRINCNTANAPFPNIPGGRWDVSAICEIGDKCYEYTRKDSSGYCELGARCGPVSPCGITQSRCQINPDSDKGAVYNCVEKNGLACMKLTSPDCQYGCTTYTSPTLISGQCNPQPSGKPIGGS